MPPQPRKSAASTPAAGETTAKKTTARKTTAKKTTPRTTAKRTTARKTTAKKATAGASARTTSTGPTSTGAPAGAPSGAASGAARARAAATESVEEALERVRAMQERLLQTVRASGEAYLDAYEKNLANMLALTERAATSTHLEWAIVLANNYADFVKRMNAAMIKASRQALR